MMVVYLSLKLEFGFGFRFLEILPCPVLRQALLLLEGTFVFMDALFEDLDNNFNHC